MSAGDRTMLISSFVKQTISDLLQNKIDMSQLVITKALAKAGKRNALARADQQTTLLSKRMSSWRRGCVSEMRARLPVLVIVWHMSSSRA